jgi:PAS domain S-box-containing protein
MSRKLSLHLRVLGIGVFVLITLFVSAFYYYNRVEQESQDERLTQTANYLGKIVALMVERANLSRDYGALEDGLARLLQNDEQLSGFRLQLYGATPRELFVTRKGAVPPQKATDWKVWKQDLHDGMNREIGALGIGFWQRSFLAESNEVTILNVIIVCDLMVMFGLFLHLLLRELVTRPLENFVEATRRVASGDLSAPLEFTASTREEDRLAASFAEMIARLRTSREEITRVNSELEQRVVVRTNELNQAKIASETVIETIADGVYTVDGERTIKVFNSAAEKLTGLKAKDVIGRKCYDVLAFPFCKTDCILLRLDEVRAKPQDGAERAGEEYLEEKGSGRRAWLVSGALFQSAAGFNGGAETIKDLSYSRKMQQQLRQVDKLTSLGILSAGVAHEINNPLSNIKIYGELLHEELARRSDLDAGSRDSLKSILDQTERASQIVRKMLEFSRQAQPEMEPLDQSEVLYQSLDMVRFALDGAGIKVDIDIAPDLPRISGSRVSLQQVFVNLFNNARQAMKDGGTLTVRARYVTAQERVVITVRDTGCGIPDGDLERIFDPFFTTKDVGEGTGLGLSISYGIIKDHRGELSVESNESGTTFTIVLPAPSESEAVK